MSSIHFRIPGFQGPTSSIRFRIQGSHGPTSGIHFRILGSQGPMTSINFRIQSPQGPTSTHFRIRNPQDPMTSRYALQDTVFPRSHEFMAYHLQPSTFNLSPKAYHLQPQTTTYNLKLPPTTYHRQGGSGKLHHFLQVKFLNSDRPSLSPVELPGTMLSIKFCIEWCRVQGL